MIHALIADMRTIRVFEAAASAVPSEVAVLHNQNAGHHERDLVSDRPGRVVNGASGMHHAYEPKRRASEHELQVWLKQIGPSIHELLESRSSEAVVLVASPRMLPKLRTSLPAAIRKRIADEVPLDLTHQSIADLKRRLRPVMSSAARKLSRAEKQSP